MLRHFRHVCFRAPVIGALVFGLIATFVAAPAWGDPIDDKRAEAAALQDQIEATNREISALGEVYNKAQLALDEAQAQLDVVTAKITETKAEVARIKGLVEERAAVIYRQASAGESIDSGFDFRSAQRLLSRTKYAELQSEADDNLLAQLDAAQAELATQRGTAQSVRDQAETERKRLADTQAQLVAASAEQQQLLAQVEGELAQLVQEELNRRQAEAQAAAQALLNSSDGSGDPNLPPPGPSAGVAIAWGMTQLGKPYQWGASGPNSYDCSGFTMAAYAAAGVSLPHYSGAQYSKLPHVPLNAMQPGDLVFWGSGGSEHVAIYIGNAQILESGGDGSGVNVGPIWGKPVGAARVLQ